MPSTYSNSTNPINTGIPCDNFARLLAGGLRRLNWAEIFVDEQRGIITATQKSDEVTMGKRWDLKFQVVARWQNTGGLANRVIFTISEGNTWSNKLCATRFEQLQQALFEDYDSGSASDLGKARIRGARFATAHELERCGYLSLSSQADEFLVAPYSNQILRIPRNDTNRHAIVCGPTGSGKTTGLFIPNLLERTEASAVVTEATGGNGIADLYTKTAGYRAAHGHKIFYFNPDDLESQQINPLDHVNTYRQARRACEIIFQSTTLRTHRGDQSWEMAERQLLTALILHAASQRCENNCNFGFINRLLDHGASGLNKVFQKSAYIEARRSYFRFIQTCTEGYRNLVINGVMTRLDAWNSPRCCKLTEQTSLDFDALQDDLFTLYLAVPADNAELKPMMALILNYVLDAIQRRRFSNPLMLLLDEFTNFGVVRNLPAKLTILRHDGIPAVLGVQDYVQLENMYDRDAKLLISQPATRIFFKPNDIDTAQKISQMLGESHKEWQRLTSAGHLQEKERKEALLSAAELLNLGVFEENPNGSLGDGKSMIVFLPNTHPVRIAPFTWQDYHEITAAYLPPEIGAVEVDESLTVAAAETEVAEVPQSAPDSEMHSKESEPEKPSY